MTLRTLLTDLRLHGHLAPHPTLVLPDNRQVAAHFHLTEVGHEQRDFLDCGGTRRQRQRAVLQLLVGGDVDHRLEPSKLLTILTRSSRELPGLAEAEIEVELTGDQTVERYQIARVRPGLVLELAPLATACLAADTCGLEPEEAASSRPAAACCEPGSGCC